MASMDDLAKRVANDAVNTIEIDGKTISEWIEEIKTRRWISVEDRLPEIGKEVLVCYDFGRMMVTALDGYWGTERLFWKYNNWITNPISVTHWMPLPEPPKEV